MVNYKAILKLTSIGYCLRQIATSEGHSLHTVKNDLELSAKNVVKWSIDEDVTNAVLEKLFYLERKTAGNYFAEPNYDYTHKKLSKKGVTLTLLWKEYSESAYANVETSYLSIQFDDKYRCRARVM